MTRRRTVAQSLHDLECRLRAASNDLLHLRSVRLAGLTKDDHAELSMIAPLLADHEDRLATLRAALTAIPMESGNGSQMRPKNSGSVHLIDKADALATPVHCFATMGEATDIMIRRRDARAAVQREENKLAGGPTSPAPTIKPSAPVHAPENGPGSWWEHSRMACGDHRGAPVTPAGAANSDNTE